MRLWGAVVSNQMEASGENHYGRSGEDAAGG